MADPLDPEDPPGETDLVEDLAFVGPGTHARGEVYYRYERDLGRADIEALKIPRGASVPPLQQLRSSHHALARCIAAGMKTSQVALITGYTPVRIHQLLKDQAFTALVEDYRLEVRGAFADLAERMKNVSLDAIEMIQERLADAPESFSVPMLLDLVRAFADRTGYGPGQDINLRVDHDYIDRPPREDFQSWQNRRNRELDPRLVEVGPEGTEDSKADDRPPRALPAPDKTKLN